MIKRSSPRARFGLASAAVIALLIFSTGSVFADTTPGPVGDARFSQSGKSAEAGASECVSNGDDTTTCSDVSISVFVGKMSDSISGVIHANQVCVWHDNFTFVDATGEIVGEPVFEYGCNVDLPAGALVFGSKLSTATIRATTVSLEQYVCDKDACVPGPSRDVTVVGTWTGVGPTTSSKYRSSGDDGTCRYAESGKGIGRDASFSGSFDGASLGPDTYAFLTDGRSTYRSRCSEV